MRRPSKLVSGVQFSGEALRRCKHYGDAAGSYPAERGSIPWRRTGVYANAERPSSKGGGCEFESRRAYSMGYGGTGRPARLWTGSLSRFEAWYPSSAAAHGLRLRLRTADGPVRPRVAALLRSCRNWQTATLEVRVFAGSSPAERTSPRVQDRADLVSPPSRGWHSARARSGR